MSTFLDDITSATPAKYIFKLQSATDTIICNPEPIEWASGTLQIKRDLDWGGVFSTFQLDSLTFVGNGAKMLNDLYTAYELNAKCTLIVYWWKKSTRTYVEFPTCYDINFNFYEKVKVGKFAFGIRVKAINSSIQTKLDNRIDIDLNVNNQTSLSLESIPQHYNIDTVKYLNYPAIDVNYTALMESGMQVSNRYAMQHTANQITFTAIPLPIINSQFSGETQEVAYLSRVQLPLVTPFFKAIYAHTLDINYYLFWEVTDRYVGSSPFNLQIIQSKANGIDPVVTQIVGFGGTVGNNAIGATIQFTVAAGDELRFVIQSPGIDAHYMAYIKKQHIAINEAVVSSPATVTEGLPVYEAVERMAQNVLDTQYPMYSEYFGRTDVYYKPGVKYAAENQLRFAHVQSGLNQRGVKINDSDAPLALNLKKLLESLRAIYNIGYSFETIEGATRLRIENYSYFFEDAEALDLSARLNHYDIQSQVMPELVPVELKCGFESFEYLSVNGRAEPNTTNSRTSIMNTATKWQNISPLRADTKGIIDNLSNPVQTSEGTTDTKGDSSIFIVKTQRDGTGWQPETDTNITIVDDTSVFKDFLFNRLFTPTRMLYRHGNRLRAGLSKYLTSSIRFQKSDKSSGLITTGDGLTALAENGDVLASTLSAPLFKAIKHTVDVQFDFADLQLLQQYPYRYITLSNTISGYLLTLKKKNNEDRAEITIIERNIILS